MTPFRMGLIALWASLAFSCASTSANKRYARAPSIENPLTGPVNPVAGYSSTGEPIELATFNGNDMCFRGTNHRPAPENQAQQYSLVVLNKDEIDLKGSPTARAVRVDVLNADSRLVPVTRTVQDTVRDGSGRVIATVDRQVQTMETAYTTDYQLCFSDAGKVLTNDSRYLVLMREVNGGFTWGIPSTRPSWVWRLPAARTVAAASVEAAKK
ncbi:MAG: hypothetical protein K1X64_21725 [Myxococcaceae bacterium]|nr:hypothetical protein [Myxococcaceae bacterium]